MSLNENINRAAREWRAANRERDRENRLRHDNAHPESRLLANAKNRSAAKGWDFDLTKEWAISKLAKGRCEVTGIPFDFARGTTNEHNPFRPSIDRRDTSLGYTQANCQMVVGIYNQAKGTWSHNDVLRLAKALMEGQMPEVIE